MVGGMDCGARLWWHTNDHFGAQIANREAPEFATGHFIEKGPAIENVFIWITVFT